MDELAMGIFARHQHDTITLSQLAAFDQGINVALYEWLNLPHI
ncbi:MAG: hypothetical protein ACPHN2_12455 [Sinimarinibacterium flocculans]|nr:hypothetical protein [Pseudomonadota bacterium]